MVLPLGDLHPTRIVPVVNYLIIAACVGVFLIQSAADETFTVSYAATPYEITRGIDLPEPVILEREVAIPDAFGQYRTAVQEQEIPQGPVPFPVWLTLLTSIFMHGGLLHLAGNMLYLWIFGDNVEEVLGHGRYLLVYLACGIAASLAQIATAPGSMIPTLGASGAIAGVMGMYLVWFPHNQVRVLVIRFLTVMPAILVIGLWIVMQLALGIGQPDAGETGGVAYAAHVGGAVAGIAFGLIFRDRARARGEPPTRVGWAPRRYRDRYGY